MSGPRVHLPAAGVHRVVTSGAQKEILVQGKDSMKECSTLIRTVRRHCTSLSHSASYFRKGSGYRIIARNEA